MGASLASFKRSVDVGTCLRYIEQTVRPELIGHVFTFTKVGSSVCRGKVDNRGDDNGVDFVWDWPKASAVIEVTDDRLSYTLAKTDRRGVPIERLVGSVVTVEIVRFDPEDCAAPDPCPCWFCTTNGSEVDGCEPCPDDPDGLHHAGCGCDA